MQHRAVVEQLARLDREARLLRLQCATHGAASAVAADDKVEGLAARRRRRAASGGGLAHLDEAVRRAHDARVGAEADVHGATRGVLPLEQQRSADVAPGARPARRGAALDEPEARHADAEKANERRVEARRGADVAHGARTVARDVDAASGRGEPRARARVA